MPSIWRDFYNVNSQAVIYSLLGLFSQRLVRILVSWINSQGLQLNTHLLCKAFPSHLGFRIHFHSSLNSILILSVSYISALLTFNIQFLQSLFFLTRYNLIHFKMLLLPRPSFLYFYHCVLQYIYNNQNFRYRSTGVTMINKILPFF